MRCWPAAISQCGCSLWTTTQVGVGFTWARGQRLRARGLVWLFFVGVGVHSAMSRILVCILEIPVNDTPLPPLPSPVRHAVNLTILEELLRSEGYDVLNAASGTEALETYLTSDPQPKLVLLDVTLPDLSGHEVGQGRCCNRCRALPIPHTSCCGDQ